MKSKFDPKTNHHTEKSGPSHHTTNHALHTNHHVMRSLYFHRRTFLLGLTCRFQSSPQPMEYQSMKSHLLHSHSREEWPGFQQAKQTTPLPFPLCDVFPFPLPLFSLKCFPFPLLVPPFPFIKFQWPYPSFLPLIFPLKYPWPFSTPMFMGASPESKEVKMHLLLKYCTKVFLICSYVLTVAAFNRRCCWIDPEVLFINVATSTLSGIGAPVCCSHLDFTASQALKSCSKVCRTSIQES